MNRATLKARAKAQLGNNIFGNKWMLGLLVCLIVAAVATLPNVIVGVGTIAMLIIMGPMWFGQTYVFLKQARDGEPMNLADVFKGFSTVFAQCFLIALMQAIFTFLWGLLFVIPGIVKQYAYSMAFYIKVDHPEYDWHQCINESKRITQGHKMELFILDLSFIGWLFVGALCLGVGTLWVAPYMEATRAQFYQELVAVPAE